MELKEFISNTLYQIISGVRDSQKRIEQEKIDAAVNPNIHASGNNKQWTNTNNGTRYHESVVFEVGLVIEKGEGSSAKVGVKACLFNGGVEGQSDKTEQSSHRIKFAVPIIYPVQGLIDETQEHSPIRSLR